MSKELQEDGETAPAAQVLVNLLVRAGKLDAAIDVAAAHLAGLLGVGALVPFARPALPPRRAERATGTVRS